jgi:hypothetical protein
MPWMTAYIAVPNLLSMISMISVGNSYGTGIPIKIGLLVALFSLTTVFLSSVLSEFYRIFLTFTL